MQRRAGFVVVAATLILVAAVGKVAGASVQPIVVQAISIKSIASAEIAHLTGEVRARVQSELSFRVGGRLVERLVDVGDRVRAGQLLARLDAEEQKAEIVVAEANLRSARARQRLAELALERQQNLLRTSVSTLAALDQAKEDIATSSEDVVAATAQLDNAGKEMSFTDLRADSDGVITARAAEVGQVAKATQPIFTLAKDGPRDGIFDVQESLYLRSVPKQDLPLNLISAPDRVILGSVREISPTIDGQAGTIRLKVDLGNDPMLPLGAPIVGRFTTNERTMIEVPWSALSVAGRDPAVWVINPRTMTASLRRVVIGRHSTTSIEIAAGLEVNELVVTEGGKFLSPGRAVILKHAATELTR